MFALVSFQNRILLAFGAVLAVVLAAYLGLTVRIYRDLQEETTHMRLAAGRRALEGLHAASMARRTGRLQGLAAEPRFRALMEIGDEETLAFAASEVQRELDCAAFAFLSPEGAVLAWHGPDQAEVRARLGQRTSAEPLAEPLLLPGGALLVAAQAVRVDGMTKGHVVATWRLDTAVLDDLARAVAARVQLRGDGREVASSSGPPAAVERTVDVPIGGGATLVLRYDTAGIGEALSGTLATLAAGGTLALAAGGLAAFLLARWFAAPLAGHVVAVRAVRDGDLAARAPITGAPELRELAWSFNEMVEYIERSRKELQEVSRLKSEFLANMSHELRTPLNAIIGYTDVLDMKLGDKLPPTARQNLKRILSNAEQLLGLINSVLDISKIEAGHLEVSLQSVDLLPILDRSVEDLQVLVRDKPVELLCDFGSPAPPRVLADPIRLRQCVVNVLANAGKFTDKGSIRVATATTPADGDRPGRLTIAVTDTGSGIAPEHQALIFEPFRQVDASRTKRHGGTGLGLAIVRQLMRAMGGDVQVSSAVGVGSTFVLGIPLAAPAATPAPSGAQQRVLA